MEKGKRVTAVLMASALFALGGGVSAQHTAGELERLQAEAIITKAKLNLAEIEEQLRQKQGLSGDELGRVSVPAVRAVYGVDKELYATLVYNNGATVTAKLGDVVPGGYTVSKITVEAVELKKGQQRVRAVFNGGMRAALPTTTPQHLQ